jgi:hypothetical protein
LTIPERHALCRFARYIVIAKGDVDKALDLVALHCPKDLRFGPMFKRIVKATK